MELNGNPSLNKNRWLKMAKDVNVKALIAILGGFPIDC